MKASHVSLHRLALVALGLLGSAQFVSAQSSIVPSTSSFFAESESPYIYTYLSSPAPAGGTTFTVTATPAGILNVPASVTVPAGGTNNLLYFTANAVTTDTVVALKIGAITTNITVKAVKVTSLPVTPNPLVGFTSNPYFYAYLNASGRSAGGGYTLAFNSPGGVLNIPSTGLVPSGTSNAYWYFTTNEVATPTDVPLRATLNGNTIETIVRVNPLVTAPLNLNANLEVFGGTGLPYAYMYTTAGPRADYPVNLWASHPAAVNLPTNFKIGAGATNNYFYFTSNLVNQDTLVTLYAQGPNGANSPIVSAQVLVKQNRPVSIDANTLDNYGGSSNVYHYVNLRGPAGSSGAPVALTSSDPAIYPVPATLNIGAGATNNYFYANSSYVTSDKTVAITATYSGGSVTRYLLIKPLRPTFSFIPRTIVGGQGSPYFYVNLPAPLRNSLTVPLTNSTPSAATIPASLNIGAGSTNNYTYFTTNPVTVPTYVRVSANVGGAIGSDEFAVVPTTASVSGRVRFGSGFNPSAIPSTITLRLTNPTTGAFVRNETVPLASNGVWFLTNAGGTFNYSMQFRSFLRRTLTNVGANSTFNDFNLINGDIDRDNEVSILDYLALSANFEKESSSVDWNTPNVDGIRPSDCDLDADDIISILDYLVLSEGFGVAGDN